MYPNNDAWTGRLSFPFASFLFPSSTNHPLPLITLPQSIQIPFHSLSYRLRNTKAVSQSTWVSLPCLAVQLDESSLFPGSLVQRSIHSIPSISPSCSWHNSLPMIIQFPRDLCPFLVSHSPPSSPSLMTFSILSHYSSLLPSCQR